jgi:hypothetical protein
MKNPAPSGGERVYDIIKGAKHRYHALANAMTMRGLWYLKPGRPPGFAGEGTTRIFIIRYLFYLQCGLKEWSEM